MALSVRPPMCSLNRPFVCHILMFHIFTDKNWRDRPRWYINLETPRARFILVTLRLNPHRIVINVSSIFHTFAHKMTSQLKLDGEFITGQLRLDYFLFTLCWAPVVSWSQICRAVVAYLLTNNWRSSDLVGELIIGCHRLINIGHAPLNTVSWAPFY